MSGHARSAAFETTQQCTRAGTHAGRELRTLAIVAAGSALAAMIMTLPLWQHPTRRLPSDLVDTLLNTWIIGWDADRLRHGLQGVWQAPIFHPYHNTLAFSENLLGIAVLVAPVYWMTANPVFTYNVALTVSFVIAAVGMYVLAAELTRSRRCGLVGAAFYAFCPFRFTQISHIQFIAVGWLPIALYGLHRYFATVQRGWLCLFVVACWFQALSNSYMAYFMALPVAVIAFDALWRVPSAQRVVDVSAAALVVVIGLMPVVVKYSAVRTEYGLVRNASEIDMGSADVGSFLVGNQSIGLWRWLPARGEAEKQLFPGIAALLLVALALTDVRKKEGARWVRVYGVIALIAVVLSLGPHPRAWGYVLTRHGPYEWLLRIVPGMSGMRVPARLASIVALGMAVLAAFGARVLVLRLRTPLRYPAIVVCIIAILAESCAVPLPVQSYAARGRATDRAVAEWLRERPSGAVLHLPVRTTNFQELNYQYATLFHSHPIVNGMSGYDSPLQLLFRETDSPLYDGARPAAVVRMLRSLGIRYVVVNEQDFNVTQLANDEHLHALALLRDSGQVVAEKRFLEAYLFELQPPIAPPAAEAALAIDAREVALTVSAGGDRTQYLMDRNADTRWIGGQDGTSWIAAAFKRSVNVARVDLRLAERSLADYPRELEIDAMDVRGAMRILYRATPYPEFIAGFVRDPKYPRITIALPENETTAITIREIGKADGRWWSVHEIELWQRRSR